MQSQVAHTPSVHPASRALAVVQAWIRKPTQVASICPSSHVLTKFIANRACIRSATTIVDLGPGTGGTTRQILRYAQSKSRILAVELTPEFIPSLKSDADPRLVVQQGNALHLEQHLQRHGLTSPDVVVSGIPFSTLDAKQADQLMATIHRVLLPGGVFISYQFRRDVVRYAEPYLGDPDTDRVWWNLPPLAVHRWVKPILHVKPVENS